MISCTFQTSLMERMQAAPSDSLEFPDVIATGMGVVRTRLRSPCLHEHQLMRQPPLPFVPWDHVNLIQDAVRGAQRQASDSTPSEWLPRHGVPGGVRSDACLGYRLVSVLCHSDCATLYKACSADGRLVGLKIYRGVCRRCERCSRLSSYLLDVVVW